MYEYVDIAYREPVQLIYVTLNSSHQSAINLGTTCGFHKICVNYSPEKVEHKSQ